MSRLSFDNEEISADDSKIIEKSATDFDVNSKMKNFLIENETINGKSIFVHLTSCIRRILEERPNNVLDIFEDISKSVSENKNRPDLTVEDQSVDVGLAQIQKDLFSRGEGDDEEAAPEEDVETPLPNMMLHAFFYEQAGIGFNREELHRIWLAMKTLVNTQPVEHARFWGKIFGIQQNYYIAEVEFREGEELEEEEEEGEVVEEERSESKQDDDEEVEDLPPKSNWKPLPSVPKEEFRTGANKKIYFVCHEPGKPWIRLPHVTPAQIMIARKVKKVFTGYLEAEVKCYPPFPGLECNLLRTQIARISAGTQVSPIGFYTFDNEEEEETEEDGAHDSYVENQEYVPPRIKDLMDATFSNWVHHTQHILPQGRCLWWNLKKKNDDEFEEGEEEEEEEVVEPEKGPSLLTPISQDLSLGGITPWSVRLSSTRIPEYAVVTVSSNLWPGAHAFAFGKHFQNIYIGWGYKNQGSYTPPKPGRIMLEFIEDKNVKEIEDPTPDEEKSLKASQDEGNDEEAQEEEEEEDNN